MVKRKKYLWQHPDGAWYVRLRGRYHRITATAGTEEFDRQYWEVLTGRRAESKRGFKALIKLYRESDDWVHHKAPRTRADYEKVLVYLEARLGNRAVERMTTADIYDAMEANRHRVRFANMLPVVLSRLFKLAIKRRWRADNPALGLELLPMPKERQKPHVPWTDAAVAKWRAEAAPLPRLIFELGVGSVQRPGDLVGFTWGDYDGDTLRLRQNKTDVPLMLPCTEALRTELDRARAALPFAPLPSRHILVNAHGHPMSYRTMADIMRRERTRLGLEAHDLHALRYRGVMELAWAGCTDEEIAAYSGHASLAMIRKYAGEARQIMRARQAREKRR